jgi:hypothetical protein
MIRAAAADDDKDGGGGGPSGIVVLVPSVDTRDAQCRLVEESCLSGIISTITVV